MKGQPVKGRVGRRGRCRLLALALGLALIFAAPLPAARAGSPVKRIPVKRIPRKNIPHTVRYRQAPAFTKRAKRNRALVRDARRQGRRLRRGGTAYDLDR